MTYPNDANGDVLRRMEARGYDMTRPRKIDFVVVFESESSAKLFVRQMQTLGHEASAQFSETAEGFPWDVIVVKQMVPSHSEIGNFEAWLQTAADVFGGHNDGWGALSD